MSGTQMPFHSLYAHFPTDLAADPMMWLSLVVGMQVPRRAPQRRVLELVRPWSLLRYRIWEYAPATQASAVLGREQ